MKKIVFDISEDDEIERIDSFLAKVLEDKSRSYLQKLIKDGSILVNKKETKASYVVRKNDNIEINLKDNIIPDILAEDIKLDILYEDSDILIVNKKKGMVVHPDKVYFSNTLVNALMFHCKDLSGINGVLRPGIVHRIDKDTTGVLVVCKNDFSHENIALQLKEHSINRKYHALVHGNIKEDSLTIDKPIGRNPKDRKKMGIVPSGKRAITHIKVLKRFKNFTYIECSLETGRTHQIRVHLSSISHPILGDELYSTLKNTYKLEGQSLHAKVLGFIHPRSNEYVEFEADLPEYFKELLIKLDK